MNLTPLDGGRRSPDRSSHRARARSVTAEQRAQVLELQAAGRGRNAIAVDVGIGAATVSKIVTDAGRSFDRTATEVATKARAADLRARRVEIGAGLLDDVDYCRALLRGQDDARGVSDVARSVNSLVYAAARLGELDDPRAIDAEVVVATLAQLGDELRLAAGGAS